MTTTLALLLSRLSLRSVLMDGGDGGGGGPAGGEASDGSGAGGDAGTGAAGSDQGHDQGQGGDDGPQLTPEQQALVQAEVQRQFSAVAAKKLDAARSKWEADLKALADAENMTVEQQAQAAAEQARKEADAAIAKANEKLVTAAAQVQAVTAGAKPDRVGALLKLADLSGVTVDDDGEVDADALKAAIETALTENPEFKAGPTAPGASGGDMSGGTPPPAKPKNLEEALRKHYGG